MVNRTIEKILLVINLLIGAAIIALVVMAKVNPDYLNYLDKYVVGNIIYVLYGLAGLYVLTGLILAFNRLPFKNSSVYVYSYASKHKRVTVSKLNVAARAAAEKIEGIKDVQVKVIPGEFGSQLHLDIKLDKRYDFALVTEQFFPVLEEVIKNAFGIRFPCYKFAHGKVAYEYSLPLNIPVVHEFDCPKDTGTEQLSSDKVTQVSATDEEDLQTTFISADDILKSANEEGALEFSDNDKPLTSEIFDAADLMPEQDHSTDGGRIGVLEDTEPEESEQDYVNRQIINSLNDVYDEDYIPQLDEDQIGLFDTIADEYMSEDIEAAMPQRRAVRPNNQGAVRKQSEAKPSAAKGTVATPPRQTATAPSRAATVRTKSGTSAKATATKVRPVAAPAKATPRPKAAPKNNNDVYERINAIIDKYTKPHGKDTK